MNMTLRILLASALLAALSSGAIAQPGGRAAPDPIPPELALETLNAAYESKPTAEEVTVRLRGPRGERSDSFIVRIDPGTAPGATARTLLEMGQLRIFIAEGELVAINTAVPGKYFRAPFAGLPTPASLAELLPPIPAPQLALASRDPHAFRTPTPYTPEVNWTDATLDTSARNPIVTLSGVSPAGPVALVAGARSGRLIGFTASFDGAEGPTTLELIVQPREPGDPAAWKTPVQGRERVDSLTALRPASTGQQPLAPGDPVPDLTLSLPDYSTWSLWRAIAAEPDRPMALLLFRAAPADPLADASRDARAGLSAVRAVQPGQSAPDQSATKAIELAPAAALVMELGQYDRKRWEHEQQQWGGAARDPAPDPRDALMWANSAAQTIDRFDPRAAALIALIGDDRRLIRTIVLDGRAENPAALAAELRAALAARAVPADSGGK